MASFAAAFYTFSPLRDSLSTLLDPANCRRCMLPCTGYPRRARAAARSATDARPRTTTAHEWSRRLTANRAVHVPLLETARRSWNGAGNVYPLPGRPPGNQVSVTSTSLSFARRVETADLVFALKRYYVLNDLKRLSRLEEHVRTIVNGRIPIVYPYNLGTTIRLIVVCPYRDSRRGA